MRRHHRRVFNFVFHLTRQRQDAEDLTQTTFIKAFTHLGSFDGSRPLILVLARTATVATALKIRWVKVGFAAAVAAIERTMRALRDGAPLPELASGQRMEQLTTASAWKQRTKDYLD